MIPMPVTLFKSLSAKQRKWLKGSAFAVVSYTLLGFLILPPIIKAVAESTLQKELNRKVEIKSFRLNPYAMSVTIRGLNIQDPDTRTLLSWDEVHVNFRLLSVFTRAWGFDNVRVINPYVRVQMNKDRTFNFTDILEAHATTNAAPRSAAPKKAVAVALRHLLVDGAKLEVTDFTPSKPFHRVIGPVRVELNDFHTDPNNRNPHVFTGTTETGETFAWGGSFSLEPVRALGEFSVENIALKELGPLYQDLVNVEIRDGLAAFSVNYAFEMSATATNASVSNLNVSLKSFKLAQPGAEANLLELPELAVRGVRGDLLSREVEVGSVAVRGAELNVFRDSSAQFNVVQAATPNSNAPAPAGIVLLMQSATSVITQLLSSTNLGTATLRELSVADCVVNYRDDACLPPAHLPVDQINVTARNISNRPDTNMTAEVSLRWNTNGTIAVGVDATLHPLTVDVDLDVQQLQLAPLDPYLRPHVNAYILGSKVGLEGRVRLQAHPGGLPEVAFAGNAGLDDLNVLGNTSEDLLRWGSLRFNGIAANLQPPAVTVSNVTLKDLAARVVVETNGQINVLAVLPPADTNAPVTVAKPEPEASGAVKSGGIKGVFAQVKTVLGMDANAAAALDLPRVEVGEVRVENSEIQFNDRSVTPHAHASLQKIDATLANISTEAMQRAKIHVQTLVGGIGPVEVTAELNPLYAKEATHAKLSLRNVPLTPADPYAGKFLGYRLTKGKLNVDVEYTITDSAVKGKNVIMLDQLTLGGKVQSPDAISLPVKLGIALMKDTEGKINIDVPIEGSLDDPKFRLGKVIWGVVANVFVKAVTSPFSLLGGLVGGGAGEDMQYQVFAPGSTELTPQAQDKLASLAKALAARPELQVVAVGNVDMEADGWVLKEGKVDQQLRQVRWNSLRAAARATTKPEDLSLPPDIRGSLVEQAYRDLIVTNPQLAFVAVPELVVQSRTNQTATATTRPEFQKGASRLIAGGWSPTPATQWQTKTNVTAAVVAPMGKPTQQQMEDSLAAAQKLVAADYVALARARAERVRAHLVGQLQIAADRVLFGDPESGPYGTSGNRVTLQLQ